MVDATAEPQTGAEDIVWDLSEYYDSADDPRIDADLQAISADVDAFVEQYRGKIADLSAAELAEAFAKYENMQDTFTRISTYASLNFSVYSTDSQWGAFLQKIREVGSEIWQKMVFFFVEWNEIPDEQAETLLNDPALSEYAYYFKSERRYKPYQLSEAEEKILIAKSVTGMSAWDRLIEQILSVLEFEYQGEKHPMPKVLSIAANDENRENRKAATDAITEGLRSRLMELTYVFNTIVADKAIDDRLRGYDDWITSRHLANKTSAEPVNALIQAVTDSYDLVQQHYRVKKALLGYDELYDYDRYAPLKLKESESHYSFQKAREIVIQAFEAFSPKVAETADLFFSENWIHAPVMKGKQGGAYASYGSKSSHPWVFLNYEGRVDDVMTMAHELGHGIHMYLAGRAQTVSGISTPLTTAEMASTFGEMLVFQDLMRKEDDKEVQLSMLTQKIDGTIATIHRQISLNRFEDALHRTRREQGELSTEQINELWMQSQHDMFGDSVTIRDDYAVWWSYITHFTGVPGYVYAYAFGELLVFALYNLYQETGADFVPKYIDLLAAGGSNDPDKLLANVGVDLNDPEFWNEGIAALRKLVDEEEALARELYPERFA